MTDDLRAKIAELRQRRKTAAESWGSEETPGSAFLSYVAFSGDIAPLLADTVEQLMEENERLRAACINSDNAVCQTLGKTLGYLRYCDDPANFPGATEADGVCVGEHTAETLASEAAREIERLVQEIGKLRTALQPFAEYGKLAGLGDPCPMVGDPTALGGTPTVGDCRLAAAVLEGQP